MIQNAAPIPEVQGRSRPGVTARRREPPERADLTTVGALLRWAREERGESLVHVSARTMISERYLEALEADDPIWAFPAPAYALFFLREYCRHLGIQEEPLVETFTATWGVKRPSVPGPTGNGARLPRTPSRSLQIAALTEPSARRGPTKRLPEVLTGWIGSSRSGLRFRRTARDVVRRAPAGLFPVMAMAVALLVLAVAVVARIHGGKASRSTAPRPAVSPRAPLQLPRGGRRIFPRYRVVAFYGAAGTESLGILGVSPAEAGRKLVQQAAAYRFAGRRILPAFELVATVASGNPGPDHFYRSRQHPASVLAYLNEVRKIKGLLVLDVQPGRSDFLTEVKVYEPFLKEPDVALALDPEWHVGPKEIPGQALGSVDAATVNQVISYLTGIVKRYDLPQKLLIIHRFTIDMVKNKARIKAPPEVAVTMDVDGYGNHANKYVKYQLFVSEDDGFYHGIKLYYRKDAGLMTPQQVLFLQPTPDLVIYQ